MSGVQLYLRYIDLSIRSQLQYRASFIIMTLGFFMVTLVDFLGIWVLFARFGSIRGWELPEVALFYGIIHNSFALAEGFGRGFDTLHRLVRSGDFDRFLLRPRSLVLQTLGNDLQLLRAGRVGQATIIMVWAINNLSISLGVTDYLLILAAITGGVLVFIGLFVLQATITFWSVESLELTNMVTHGGVETAQFPIDIYTPWFRNIFIFLFPIATINYFPLLGVLNKQMGVASYLPWMSPLIGLLFFILCLQVFKLGVRFYKSTGS